MRAEMPDVELAISLAKLWPNWEYESSAVAGLLCRIGMHRWRQLDVAEFAPGKRFASVSGVRRSRLTAWCTRPSAEIEVAAMSHEGIKFVSAEEAGREDAPKLTGDAIRPVKVKVDQSGGTGVVIEWADGHRSSWDFGWLRAACPCATCHEEREKDGREPGVAKARAASLLPMYEAPARPKTVAKVGNYAIRFTWSDGHEAGLYSWDYLRNGCEEGNRKQKTGSRK